MAKEQKSKQTDSNQAQMEQLRQLVLGQNNEQITQAVKQNAREIVSDVFSEALHDRQKLDGSVNKVIVPLVEKSVERSVNNHSEKMVGYLYPLVGRLVRKSVSAFLNEFLEKTNELIENSLTIKGLKWRYRAWQSGLSFSQYVASQTFVFRVEQVLLIHRETGILLNSVSYNRNASADVDMVSGMLTAIDDFVSDSFTSDIESDEQHLDVIKTNDFTLVLKRGPQAVLVAAVTGNMPQSMADQLQITLEYVQRLYGNDLVAFKGDTLPFESVDQQLNECLLAEVKPELTEKEKKRPWFALILLFGVTISFVAYLVIWWQQHSLAKQLQLIDNEPGIIVSNVQKQGLFDVNLILMRDPDSQPVLDWLRLNNLRSDNIYVTENQFLSMESALLKTRIDKLLTNFPTIEVSWTDNGAQLNGRLSNARRKLLSQYLSAIPGMPINADLLKNIEIIELDERGADNPAVLKALLELNIAKVESVQLEFDKGESELSAFSQEQLKILGNNFQSVVDLANKQQLSVGLIIMGASDPVGSIEYNQRLSKERARAAQGMLVELGIEPGYLNAIGLGVVESKSTGKGVRKVLFNIVYFDSD